MGWRLLFLIVGAFFVIVGLIIFASVKDPVRGWFSYNYKPIKTNAKDLLFAYFKVLTVPCARWGLLGIFFKAYASAANGALSVRWFLTYGT